MRKPFASLGMMFKMLFPVALLGAVATSGAQSATQVSLATATPGGGFPVYGEWHLLKAIGVRSVT